jgi:hypothetical protein
MQGYYFGLHPGTNTTIYPKKAYFDGTNVRQLPAYLWGIYRCVELMEILFSETAGTILRVERTSAGYRPIREPRDLEGGGAQVISRIQEAALGELRLGVPLASRRRVKRSLWLFMSWPSAAALHVLGDIVHTEGVGGYGRRYALARPQQSLGYYWFHPWRWLHDYRQAWWRRGFTARLFGNAFTAWRR